jgi:hypothetical protein
MISSKRAIDPIGDIVMKADREPNIPDIPHNITNAIIKAVSEELECLGMTTRLGDDGSLRRAVHEMVLQQLAEPQNAHLTGAKSPALYTPASRDKRRHH